MTKYEEHGNAMKVLQKSLKVLKHDEMLEHDERCQASLLPSSPPPLLRPSLLLLSFLASCLPRVLLSCVLLFWGRSKIFPLTPHIGRI